MMIDAWDKAAVIAPLTAPKRRTVRDQVIGFDLAFLMACLNWAILAGDERGGVHLERNTLKGLPVPREARPKRPALTEGQYLAVQKAARVRSRESRSSSSSRTRRDIGRAVLGSSAGQTLILPGA